MRKFSLLSTSFIGVVLLLLIGMSGHFVWKEISSTDDEQLISKSSSFDVSQLKGKEKYAHYQALYNKYRGWSKKDLKKIAKQDRPDLAMLQDFLRTADPNTGDIPENAVVKANKLTDLRVGNMIADRAITGVNWTERGPNDVGGRTRALMYDPNDATNKKVWAGGVGGGLWYTNDITVANPTWVAVDNFWENIAISSIAYDPSNTQTMYVATGEGWLNGGAQRSGGIWKTTNGGTTWARLPSSTLAVTGEFAYLQKIVVTPTGRVLVSCRNGAGGGIYSSTNGGATWVEVLNGEGGADIEVAANGDVYASINFLTQYGFATGELHKSTTDGATWNQVTSLNAPANSSRIEIASAPSNSQIVYAVGSDGRNIAFFKKSTNGGTSWTSVTVPKYLNQNCSVSTTDFTRGQSWYDLILKVNPTDSDHVVVGGIDVHRTTNGGTSWSSISYWTRGCGQYVHADIHEFAYNPGNSDEMLVGSDGGISYSSNIRGGTPAFSDKNSGYNVTQFYAVAMNPNDGSNYFLAGAQDNGTRKLTSAGIGGSTQPTGGDGAFCFIDQDNPNIQITSYVFNSFYKSTNGGATFSALGSQDQNSGEFINPADYHDALDLLYSSSKGSRDVARWTVPAGNRSNFDVTGMAGDVTHLKASPFSAASTTLYLGTSSGEVVRVTNANTTGTSKAGTVLSNATMQGQGSVSSIEFGATVNQIVVTYSNYGAQNVWYTTNGGGTWTSKDNGHGLPNMPVRWAMFNPNAGSTNEVLIATETGVWSTDDITASAAGDFWELTSTGLANVRCDMFQIRSSDNLVAVATHGRGVFTTNAFSPASANFASNTAITYVNKNVTFTDLSAGANSWAWNFGAGANTATANTVGPHVVSYSTPGVKTITLNINGGGGVLTTTRTITVLPNRATPYTLTDGGNFEVNLTDFAAENVGGTTNWQRGNSAVAGKNGVVSGSNAWVTGLVGDYVANSHSNLYTPNFNFSAGGTYTLSFQTKHNYEDDWDGMIVEYSTNKGDSWTKLGAGVAGNAWYNSITENGAVFGNAVPIMSGIFANYATKTLNVSSLAGNTDVAFRVVFMSDTNTEEAGGAIDDFVINYSSVSTPSVNLSVSANTGSEAATTVVTVTATASSAVTGDKTVDLGVTGVGITAGDYTLSNTTITIPNGSTTGSVTFTIVDDALVEATETANLAISNPSSGIALGTTTTQTIIITDNDDNDLCSGASSVTCGNSYTGSTLGKGNDTPAECVVSSGTGGGVWYKLTGNNSNVTISTCNTGTDFDTQLRVYSGSCAGLTCVTGNDDDSSCGLSSTVNFDAFVGTDYYILVHGFSTSEGNYEMSVNCTPLSTVNLSVSANVGSEAAATVVTVTATTSSAVTGGDKTVDLGVAGTGITAGDYTLSNTTITIPNGNTTGSVTFTVVDDVLIEGAETANLTISNPSNGIALGTTTTQDVVITDNDNYTIAITEFSGNPSGTEATNEWIELYNYGAAPVDIQNWRLKDEDSDNSNITTSSYSIPAGQYLILAKDKTTFEAQWLAGAANSQVIQVAMTLANGADEIILEDNANNTVWSVAYANDDTEGRATFYSENTYTTNIWGSKVSPGISRNGNDNTTGTLGYESNNNTTDVLARTATTGDIGSPLNLALPEINVQGNSNDILDGSTTPVVTNNTDFGNVAVSRVITYTIQNTGNADLTVSSIVISGTHNADFVVSNITTPATISASGTTTFDVTFTPGTVGLREAIITLNNNDTNEAVYDFAVQGTGIVAGSSEINLAGNDISIPSGTTTTSTTNNTDLGQTLGAALSKTFAVQNVGTSTLTVSSITSSNPSFVVSNAPSSIIVNWQEYFTVTFSPTTSGVQTSTITINSNDSDEGSYTFVVKGEGVCPVTPTISISANNIAPNQVSSIRIESKLGATYQLQDVSNGNVNVGNPIQGTGNLLYLQTPPLAITTDFRVVASRGLDCGYQILNTVTITVVNSPYGYEQTQINNCNLNSSLADIDLTINGSSYLWSNSITTQDINDVMNGLYSVIIDGTSTMPVIVGTPVQWKNPIRATISEDGRITSSGTFAWDNSEAAATSKAVLEANEDGGFTYLIEDLATIPNSMIGLSTPNLMAAYTSIKNSFYIAADGSLFVYYDNTLSQDTQIDVAVNDRLTMTRVGNEIRYYHNSTLVYTDVSAVNQTNRLVVDIAMVEGQSPQVWFSKCAFSNMKVTYNQNTTDDCTTGIGEGTINLSPQEGVAPYSYLWADANTSNPRSGLSIGLQNVTVTDATNNSQVIPVVIGVPIVWTDLQNVVQNSGILAAESTASYTTAGAVSAAGFTGDGGVTYFYDATNTTYMVGLSAANSDPAWTSLGYSIYAAQNEMYVYESGALVHTNTSLNDGDRISILRQSGVIKYYINEQVAYTSTVTPATTLYADATVSQGFSPLVYASFCTQIAANIELNFVQTSVDDCTTGAAEGAITLTGSGGTTATYSYNWDSGASTANPRNNLSRGLYSIEMTNGANNKTTPIVVGGFINWTNLTANTTQIGGTVTTNTPASWSSPEGGISSNRLASNGEGGVTYIVDDLNKAGNYQIGLSLPTATATTWQTLGYSAYIGLQNRFIIYENGTQYGPFDPILAGDRISIIRRAGNIEYYVNSTLIRQVATTMTDELAADISFINGTCPIVYASFCNPGFRIPNKIEATQKVNEVDTDTETFVVYPNPSTGKVNVRWTNLEPKAEATIRVIDVLGRVLINQKVTKSTTTLNTTFSLEKEKIGVYVIEVISNNKIKRFKVIKE